MAALKLRNVTVTRARLEEFTPDQRFSCLLSRAFGRLPALIEHSARLLEPGGLVVIMKGAYPEAALAASKAAGLDARITPLSVPGLSAARHLLLVEAP